ncbi:selenoprotein [Alicycliphilus sp. B1]|nr:selenoprotein [Alicycliphilus sp. B1]
MGAGVAGQGDEVFQGLVAVGLHGVLQPLQRLLEQARLGQHLVAVGAQDVAPHLRVAGGDAREVAKARAGQRQQFVGVGLGVDAREHGERQHVGQVAHGGEGGVVRLGDMLLTRRAASTDPRSAQLGRERALVGVR